MLVIAAEQVVAAERELAGLSSTAGLVIVVVSAPAELNHSTIEFL